MTGWFWVVLVFAVWAFVAVYVAVLLGRAIDRRDRQVPHDADPKAANYDELRRIASRRWGLR